MNTTLPRDFDEYYDEVDFDIETLVQALRSRNRRERRQTREQDGAWRIKRQRNHRRVRPDEYDAY